MQAGSQVALWKSMEPVATRPEEIQIHHSYLYFLPCSSFFCHSVQITFIYLHIYTVENSSESF